MNTKTLIISLLGIIIFIAIIISLLPGNSPSTPASVKITGDVVQDNYEPEPIPTESVEQETLQEERCEWGHSDEYKCDGRIIRQKWVSSDCSYEWFYYLTCSYDCQDGECVDAPQNEEPEPEQEEEPTKGYFLVTRVIDGDTIEIEGGERIRLICINTPETGEDGYKEAKDFLIDSILNKEVKLIKDVTERDRYERLLRYIYLKDGTFVNEQIARLGYGVAYPYGQDTTLCPLIESAEKLAERDNLGIWDVETQEEDQQDEEYVCSTNVYNCGDFNSHSEAQSVFDFCGGIDNDVHKLDGDYDGIACEGLL